jgi:hypothetical protein
MAGTPSARRRLYDSIAGAPDTKPQPDLALAALQCSKEYRASMTSTYRALLRLDANATVGHLPKLLEAYRGGRE